MLNQKQRPVGVTLVALMFLWIGGFGTVVFPIFAFAAIGHWTLLAHELIHSDKIANLVIWVVILVWFLAYVAYLFIGIGLWKLRNWARKAIIGLNSIAAAAFAIVVPFVVRPALLSIPLLLGVLPPVAWLISYFRRPRIRFAFGAIPPLEDGSFNLPPHGLSKTGIAWIVICSVSTICLFVVSVLGLVQSLFKSNPAYQMAIQNAQQSPCIVKAIGSPIQPGWFTSGETSETNREGKVDLDIPISGPRGAGSLELEAVKENGYWKIESLVFAKGVDRVQLAPASGDCH